VAYLAFIDVLKEATFTEATTIGREPRKFLRNINTAVTAIPSHISWLIGMKAAHDADTTHEAGYEQQEFRTALRQWCTR
jgi:hypothetical protein